VDADLEPAYSNELVFGISHEVNSDVQVSGNFIYRHDLNLWNTVDIGVPFSSYTPTDALDPGPDGLAGTSDDAILTVYARDPETIGRSENLLTNPEGSERTYKGFELNATKRFADNWQAAASLVVSDLEVVKPTTISTEAGIFDSPNGLINAKGRDPNNAPYQLKLQGMYMFRFGLTLSGFYRLAAGEPYTRQLVVTGLPQGPFNVFAEPRGESQTDTVSQLDLRFEQDFALGSGRIGVTLDVFNLFNAAAITDYGDITGVDYGRPQNVQRPRSARIGARYTW
jgi:outer membrane receptor protein involved in Fe transport